LCGDRDVEQASLLQLEVGGAFVVAVLLLCTGAGDGGMPSFSMSAISVEGSCL